jgi:hypothetical protein
MDSTLYDIGVATLMVAVIVALIVWLLGYMGTVSARRMKHMLMRAGVDPEIARLGDVEAIMKDVRRRCERCPSEALCDRWLAGKAEGDNDFCPNAPIFSSLASVGAKVASSAGQAGVSKAV